jgi:hypothetical protein
MKSTGVQLVQFTVCNSGYESVVKGISLRVKVTLSTPVVESVEIRAFGGSSLKVVFKTIKLIVAFVSCVGLLSLKSTTVIVWFYEWECGLINKPPLSTFTTVEFVTISYCPQNESLEDALQVMKRC